jgi:hypothetical protein
MLLLLLPSLLLLMFLFTLPLSPPGAHHWHLQGMQRNPNMPTIEAELEAALVKAGAISDQNAGSFQKVMLTAPTCPPPPGLQPPPQPQDCVLPQPAIRNKQRWGRVGGNDIAAAAAAAAGSARFCGTELGELWETFCVIDTTCNAV